MMAKLLVLDVDGCMTNGTKSYDKDGNVIAKSFCDLDFTAIKCFQRDGWKVCWLSADRNVNEAVARDRGIDFYYSRSPDGTIDKVQWLKKLVGIYGAVEVKYVGDDLFDLPIMRAVAKMGGYCYCPASAAPQVRNAVHVDDFGHRRGLVRVLAGNGGHGAIMELYYLLSTDDSPPSH